MFEPKEGMSLQPSERKREEIRVRIWDVPIRVFHWLTVALFAFSWWSAENDRLDWHMLSGYGILTLVLFRIYWGFVGSTTARFASFLKSPRAALDYLRHLPEPSGNRAAGHNALGGWSVALMLLLLLSQTTLGLFAVDVDGIVAGPLDRFVSFETGRLISSWHGLVFNLLLVVVAAHIAAIGFYAIFKRENLTRAMVVGIKRMPREQVPTGLRFRSMLWAVPGLLAAGLLVALIARGHL
jgi:cytochrome b